MQSHISTVRLKKILSRRALAFSFGFKIKTPRGLLIMARVTARKVRGRDFVICVYDFPREFQPVGNLLTEGLPVLTYYCVLRKVSLSPFRRPHFDAQSENLFAGCVGE